MFLIGLVIVEETVFVRAKETQSSAIFVVQRAVFDCSDNCVFLAGPRRRSLIYACA